MPDTPKDKLKKMTSWNTNPALTEAELDELLLNCRIADPAGVAPGGTGYVPTYDLNAGACAGWMMKAARASNIVDAPASGPVTSKLFDNCRMMARIYARKCSGVIGVRKQVES